MSVCNIMQEEKLECRIATPTNFKKLSAVVAENRNKKQFSSWYTRELINTVRMKSHYFRMLRNNKHLYYLEKYKNTRRAVKKDINLAFKNFAKKSENDLS